jgi:serine/threonine protein kinase
MAETFLAVRRGLGGFEQRVCVKRILPAFEKDAAFVRQFLEEARVSAQLRHANVAQVVDFGTVEGSHYLALELVDGMDLHALLRALAERGDTMAPGLVVYLATELATALEYAHEGAGGHGASAGPIVHRDISPSNVLVSRAGEVKLTDFGIAKAVSTSTTLTTTGVIKGKVPYMAPEYALSGRFETRSDLFALGVLLYEALAGRRPFVGATDLDTLHRILEGRRPALGELCPSAPKKLVEAIERLLEPKPENRFGSAIELLDALVDVAAPPTSRRVLGDLVRRLDGRGASTPAPKMDAPEIDAPKIDAAKIVSTPPGIAAPEKEAPSIEPTSAASDSPPRLADPVPVPAPPSAETRTRAPAWNAETIATPQPRFDPAPTGESDSTVVGPRLAAELSDAGTERIRGVPTTTPGMPLAPPPPVSTSARAPAPVPVLPVVAPPASEERIASRSAVDSVATRTSDLPPLPSRSRLGMIGGGLAVLGAAAIAATIAVTRSGAGDPAPAIAPTVEVRSPSAIPTTPTLSSGAVASPAAPIRDVARGSRAASSTAPLAGGSTTIVPPDPTTDTPAADTAATDTAATDTAATDTAATDTAATDTTARSTDTAATDTTARSTDTAPRSTDTAPRSTDTAPRSTEPARSRSERASRHGSRRSTAPVEAASATSEAAPSSPARPTGRLARITVAVAPHGEIRIDGERVGDTPYVGDVAPGRHTIEAISSLGRRFHRVVELAPGSSQVFNFR